MSESDDIVPANYARRVGERLRAVRKQKRLSLQAVEADSGQEFKASVLGAYERGERAISVPRLQRLARFYQVPVDQLLPRDPDAMTIDLREESNGRTGRPAAAPAATAPAPDDTRVMIDLLALERVEGPERDLLARYLGAIQVQRQDFNGRVLTIRNEDVRVLGFLLQTTAESLRHRFDELGVRMHHSPC